MESVGVEFEIESVVAIWVVETEVDVEFGIDVVSIGVDVVIESVESDIVGNWNWN